MSTGKLKWWRRTALFGKATYSAPFEGQQYGRWFQAEDMGGRVTDPDGLIHGTSYLECGGAVFTPLEPLSEPAKVHTSPTYYEKVAPATAPLPDANPKTRFGIAKPPLNLIPGAARAHISLALADGQAKYGRANWRDDPVTASTYLNACERHLIAWTEGEGVAADSKVHHLAHAAACLIILLDAEACGTLQDDRPTATPFGELLVALTKPMEPTPA